MRESIEPGVAGARDLLLFKTAIDSDNLTEMGDALIAEGDRLIALNNTHSRARRPFHPLSLPDLDDLELPEPDYIVGGLIVAGSLILLSGREKSGKSLLALDLACSIAAGEMAMGRSTRAGSVLFCAAEDSVQTLRERLRLRLAGDLSRDGRPLHLLPIAGVEVGHGSVEPVRLNLPDPESILRLQDTIETYRPSLVIIDPLREIHSSHENEADEMAPVMRPLRALAHGTGTTIFVIHHASRGGGRRGEARGSTAIGASCDTLAEWSTDDDSDGSNQAINGTLSIRGRDVPRTSLRLRMSDGLRFHPVELPPEASSPNLRGKIITALAKRDEMSADQIATAIDAPIGSVKNTLSKMLQESVPIITRQGAGHRGSPGMYSLTTRHDPKHHVQTGAMTQTRAMTDDAESRDESDDRRLPDVARF